MSPNPKMMPPSVAYRRTLLKSRILTLRTVALLSITLSFLCFSLLLLFIWSSSMFTRQQFKAATPCQKFDPISLHLDQAFMDILTRNRRVLFLLEPFLLTRLIGSDTEDFKWRFNLPQEFKWKPSSLTVGVFADQLNNIKITNYSNQSRISGPKSPFITGDTFDTVPHHFFYQFEAPKQHRLLHLHIVVFHRVKHFFWIGSLPSAVYFSLTDDSHFGPARSHNLHFGRTEQIFDLFALTHLDTFSLPDDARHFLSQLGTSQYLHCNPKKSSWLWAHNYTLDEEKIAISEKAITHFKAFMRQMEMQFWMACGTLLGWYRQCGIIPYTTDIDFATWSKYLKGTNQTHQFMSVSGGHSLDLSLRFGEPTATAEYSFLTVPDNEKVDLFFIYPNGSHYLLPFHAPPEYSYSVYRPFDLCSGELLGWKVLVPCDPEDTIRTEYGPNWDKPVEEYDSTGTSPFNVLPLMPYPFNGSQMEEF